MMSVICGMLIFLFDCKSEMEILELYPEARF